MFFNRPTVLKIPPCNSQADSVPSRTRQSKWRKFRLPTWEKSWTWAGLKISRFSSRNIAGLPDAWSTSSWGWKTWMTCRRWPFTPETASIPICSTTPFPWRFSTGRTRKIWTCRRSSSLFLISSSTAKCLHRLERLLPFCQMGTG